MKHTANILLALAVVLLFTACKQDANSPGYEYMPDMYRSPAIEAYIDYGQEPWRIGDSLAVVQRHTPSARKPQVGTIAQDPNGVVMNSMPYIYPNTAEAYEQAGVALTSPIATTQTVIDEGKAIYDRMCMHCHGEKGKGDGTIAANGHIEGIPAYDVKLADLPVGKMFHTLTYGKGLMGSHASQLSVEERWVVIEYVKVLQGTSVLDGQESAAMESDEGSEEHAAEDHQ